MNVYGTLAIACCMACSCICHCAGRGKAGGPHPQACPVLELAGKLVCPVL